MPHPLQPAPSAVHPVIEDHCSPPTSLEAPLANGYDDGDFVVLLFAVSVVTHGSLKTP